ncbi:MAG TPA: hypothetical protein VJI32_04005 [Candidatus Nanoarchaeia archaeon]|nr:hypothetical protein [Candidatus Nanoarchaeia archaeon]
MINKLIFDCGRFFLHDQDTEVMIKDIVISCDLEYSKAAKKFGNYFPHFKQGHLNYFIQKLGI